MGKRNKGMSVLFLRGETVARLNIAGRTLLFREK